jgi:tetratricopeptide (TPR) repeat protein
VATALLLGSALLEGGDARSALGYYRFAHESMPDDPVLARRYVGVALEAGRADTALTTLEDLVERFPDDLGLARQHAQLLAMTGRTDEALAATEDLLERFPGDPFGRELRIDLLQQTGRTEEALAAVDAMIEDEPEEAAWRIRRGDLLLELERPEETEVAWRRALELDPASIEAVDRISELLRVQGREDELLVLLEDLVDQDALGPTQQARLADLYLARGDRERTVELLLPMARDGVLEPRARMIVADLLASLDRRREAIDVLEPMIDEPSADPARVRRTIGELAMELDDYDRAVRELRRAASAAPEDGDAHVSLLLAMTQANPDLLTGSAGDREASAFRRWLDRAADAVSDDSVRQNFLLGALLRREGSTERAQPWLERAAELDPDNFQVLYDLAVVQESNRDFEGARATLERLLELEPDDAHLKNFYGYLLADQGWELERAERLIREAVAEEPDNGAYVDSLGWVLYRQGEYEKALDHLIEAVNLLGDDPVVLEHVGECLAALGRHSEALRSFERAVMAGGDPERLEERIEAMREAMREQP